MSQSNLVCPKCRDWEGCKGYKWYTVSDIVYCRVQCLWLIETFLTIKGDQIVMDRFTWPSEEGTGYTEAPKTSFASAAHAPYEKIVQCVGILSARLENTGKDGRLLVLEVENESVELSKDARNALNYSCGGNPKRMKYPAWLRFRKYNKKKMELLYKNVK
jgi:hypothetical protein